MRLKRADEHVSILSITALFGLLVFNDMLSALRIRDHGVEASVAPTNRLPFPSRYGRQRPTLLGPLPLNPISGGENGESSVTRRKPWYAPYLSTAAPTVPTTETTETSATESGTGSGSDISTESGTKSGAENEDMLKRYSEIESMMARMYSLIGQIGQIGQFNGLRSMTGGDQNKATKYGELTDLNQSPPTTIAPAKSAPGYKWSEGSNKRRESARKFLEPHIDRLDESTLKRLRGSSSKKEESEKKGIGRPSANEKVSVSSPESKVSSVDAATKKNRANGIEKNDRIHFPDESKEMKEKEEGGEVTEKEKDGDGEKEERKDEREGANEYNKIFENPYDKTYEEKHRDDLAKGTDETLNRLRKKIHRAMRGDEVDENDEDSEKAEKSDADDDLFYPENSDSSCPKKEVYTECGSVCEPSCAEPEPVICSKMCYIGCRCAEGLYRDESSGSCVPLSQCST